MASFDMTQPGALFGYGSGFSGLAHTGLAAFEGFRNAQDFYENQRRLEQQRMLDSFRLPAAMAGYQQQFEQNAYNAQRGANQLNALYANMAPTAPAPQQPQAPLPPVMQPQVQLDANGAPPNITRPTIFAPANAQDMDIYALQQAMRRAYPDPNMAAFNLPPYR